MMFEHDNDHPSIEIETEETTEDITDSSWETSAADVSSGSNTRVLNRIANDFSSLQNFIDRNLDLSSLLHGQRRDDRLQGQAIDLGNSIVQLIERQQRNRDIQNQIRAGLDAAALEALALLAADDILKEGSLTAFVKTPALRTPESIAVINKYLAEKGADVRVRGTFVENPFWGTTVRQADGTTRLIPSRDMSRVELYSESTGVVLNRRSFIIPR